MKMNEGGGGGAETDGSLVLLAGENAQRFELSCDCMHYVRSPWSNRQMAMTAS